MLSNCCPCPCQFNIDPVNTLPEVKRVLTMTNLQFTPPPLTSVNINLLLQSHVQIHGINVSSIPGIGILVKLLFNTADIPLAINLLNSAGITNIQTNEVAVVQFRHEPTTQQLINFIICLSSKGLIPSFTYLGFNNRYAISPLNISVADTITLIGECIKLDV